MSPDLIVYLAPGPRYKLAATACAAVAVVVPRVRPKPIPLWCRCGPLADSTTVAETLTASMNRHFVNASCVVMCELRPANRSNVNPYPRSKWAREYYAALDDALLIKLIRAELGARHLTDGLLEETTHAEE